MCQVSAVLTIFYIYTLVTYPAYEFPQPTGPHKVGYRTLRVNDGFYSKVAM
jgi:platelet-activating factor acetylhydrolase